MELDNAVVDVTSASNVDSELLTLAEISSYTRVPIGTLQWRRKLGMPPRTFKLGGRIVARRSDIDAWIRDSAEQDRSYSRSSEGEPA